MTLSFPTRRSSDLLGGHVVDGDEDLLERVLDDSGEGAVPTVLLAAEGESPPLQPAGGLQRSEEHTSELQSLMRISYAVFCLKKKQKIIILINTTQQTR